MHNRSSSIARRCLVAGRVQGVFFRASARQRAIELRCRGYAHNLADGRVEALVVGDPLEVQAFIDWLWLGPPAAHVTGVEVQELTLEEAGEHTGFETR